MGTYYVTKESQEIAGCRLIRYGIGCRWREILGLSHNRQAVEWLVERCNTLELDPIHLEDVVQDFLWEQGEQEYSKVTMLWTSKTPTWIVFAKEKTMSL